MTLTQVGKITKIRKNGNEYLLGTGDVVGPDSSTNGNLVLFDGTDGKKVKDSGKSLSNLVQTTGAQTIAGTKTFSSSPYVPSKSSAAGNNATRIATEAQVYLKQDTLVSGTNIKTINNESILGSGNITISGGGGSGDVSYDDFEFSTATSGATLTISSLSTAFSPSANFTVSAGTVKEGMQYILRLTNGGTAYTMTLGNSITNPYEEDLTLEANTITTIVFLATSSSTLEVFAVRSFEVSSLLTSAEIASMASNEGYPRTNTIAELNGNASDYYTQLNGDSYIAPSGTAVVAGYSTSSYGLRSSANGSLIYGISGTPYYIGYNNSTWSATQATGGGGGD